MQEDCTDREIREKIQENYKYLIEHGILRSSYWLYASAPCASPQAREWNALVTMLDMYKYGIQVSIEYK